MDILPDPTPGDGHMGPRLRPPCGYVGRQYSEELWGPTHSLWPLRTESWFLWIILHGAIQLLYEKSKTTQVRVLFLRFINFTIDVD